ncbi:hypothetical protein AYO38_06825 [bacterium SCGC AG-212-C10]|nr:hypothetical protein AYO38_06825 [bacterium SCGC AG-212-C10]
MNRVLIPVNRLDRAKGRLSDFLTPTERSELALTTLRTVIAAVHGAGATPVILTADDRVATEFAAINVLREDSGLAGLNAQLERALVRLEDDASVRTDAAILPHPPTPSPAAAGEGEDADAMSKSQPLKLPTWRGLGNSPRGQESPYLSPPLLPQRERGPGGEGGSRLTTDSQSSAADTPPLPRSRERGGEGILILHADLPLADAASIAALFAGAPAAPSVTLVESPDGGTNAMLLCPPAGFPLAYGRGSFALHVAAARAARHTVSALGLLPLTLDLDTPADIATLLASETGRASAAGQLLLSWRVAARFAARP